MHEENDECDSELHDVMVEVVIVEENAMSLSRRVVKRLLTETL